MALSVNTPRSLQLGDREDLPVLAAKRIFEGAAVSIAAAGYAQGLDAGEPFAGFAVAEADNTGGASGAIKVTVLKRGAMELTVVGATLADNKRTVVYASDDGTFTTTATSNSKIGWISRVVSGTLCIVDFQAVNA